MRHYSRYLGHYQCKIDKRFLSYRVLHIRGKGDKQYIAEIKSVVRLKVISSMRKKIG